MKENVYHYTVPLPEGINEAVMPGFDGYTVYTSDRLDQEGTLRAYNHALRHIRNHDFETEILVGTKEFIAHGGDNEA